MFEEKYGRGWHLWGPYVITFSTYSYVHNALQDNLVTGLPTWDAKALLIGVVGLTVIHAARINFEIGLRKWRDAKLLVGGEEPAEPEPEPRLPDGLQPVIRVNGKPHAAYAFDVKAIKINKARHIAITALRQLDNGYPVDLTEETWARRHGKKQKFCSRRELNTILEDWDLRGITFRISAAKNAKRDILSRARLEEVARGRTPPPLP